MKLTDVHNKTMKEVLEECDIIGQKICTDDNGNIKTIDIKYRPKGVDTGNIDVPKFVGGIVGGR